MKGRAPSPSFNQPVVMKLKINRLQHIGIPITDPVRSLAFYGKLGFEVVMNSSFTEKEGDGICWMLKNNEIILELYLLPSARIPEIQSRKDGHIDHIAFDVDDIDEVFNILKKNGFCILEDAPVRLGFWENGCRYINIKGPDGEILEFCEIMK